LKKLAEEGRTIITSIHQPRSSIVNLFDYLIIVTEGKIVYNAKNTECDKYFSDLGILSFIHQN
jgi:ABC-type multidrug transport system ATPase subunit